VSPDSRFHVLHLAEDFLPPDQLSGGVRVAAYHEALELARRGRITVLAPRIVLPPLKRYKEARGFSRANAARATAAADPPGVRVLRPPYLHVPILWPITEPLQLLLLGLWAVLFHARNVSLAHGHRIYPMGMATVLLGLFTGLRTVVTSHGTGLHTVARTGRLRVRAWTRFTLARATKLIVVSRDLSRIAGELGVSETRRRYIPNGVDIECFRPGDTAKLRQQFGLGEKATVYLCLGYFFPVKGHAVLVKAFARLVEKRPDAVLVLAGDGPLLADVKRQVADAGLSERVRFLGAVDHVHTVPWLQTSDALVLPSFNEGTPLVTLEALACGKPVVGTAVGGTSEVVSDERFGLLVPAGDDTALAQAMDEAPRRAWDIPTLRARAAEYSWPRIVDQICEVYAEMFPDAIARSFRAAPKEGSIPS
jgi:glycosyltransferase involved in cell wall biosynthesis